MAERRFRRSEQVAATRLWSVLLPQSALRYTRQLPIIPKPNLSSPDGINYCCRRFDFAASAQSVAAMTPQLSPFRLIVAVPTGRCRSTLTAVIAALVIAFSKGRRRSSKHSRGDSVFAIVLGVFRV